MLRQALCKTAYKNTPEKAIILPIQQTIDEIKKNDSAARSSDNLAEMCNFNNDPISCTPPDGYFMHNLRLRMEKA